MALKEINGVNFYQMIKAGAITLRANMQKINDLNVFPIADGDTATNMYMTLSGGLNAVKNDVNEDLGIVAGNFARGMLMGARGNSGVILSQIFYGIADGFNGKKVANANDFCTAFKLGTKKAYEAVMEPTEGTILTVMREATENAEKWVKDKKDCGECVVMYDYLNAVCGFMQTSLENTPNLLAVLKDAGVVDSGGAGLVCIMEGMRKALSLNSTEKVGENAEGEGLEHNEMDKAIAYDFNASMPALNVDLSKFTENSVMKFGYCTEFLLRLQNCKIDVNQFNLQNFKGELEGYGDSIVTFQNGTIVKVHIHTFNPENVLTFCHKFGEFLTIKIENMTLQHNETHNAVVENWNGEKCETNENIENTHKTTAKTVENATKMQSYDCLQGVSCGIKKKKYATVAVASGQGICNTFKELGADYVVDGGQSNNPSTQDFLNAFNEVNAENIFVLPNNSNIILTAKQASELYKDSNVIVIESKNIGEGYAVLQMLNYDFDSVEEIRQNMIEAMQGVQTALVSKAVRNAEIDSVAVSKDCYVGFVGKKIITSADTKIQTALQLMDGLNAQKNEFAIIIYGDSFTRQEKAEFKVLATSVFKGVELFEINGGQSIYDMIIILE